MNITSDFRFFINHDLVQIVPLGPVLKQIRKFLELAPQEVVILDFHRFPYPSAFANDLHHKLVSVIEKELGHTALPPSGIQTRGPTLNEIWSQNKSLIICYANRDIARGICTKNTKPRLVMIPFRLSLVVEPFTAILGQHA